MNSYTNLVQKRQCTACTPHCRKFMFKSTHTSIVACQCCQNVCHLHARVLYLHHFEVEFELYHP
uniref:Uncharacterized protein n=1 Tax=Aegilops tauschii subsp. strangulata TaxID=200361 RepID=A0A453KLH5_AEGTS